MVQDLPAVVHFHGGFLDGMTSRTGDPLNGGILDYWHAERFHAATLGKAGLFMDGVSPEAFGAMKAPSATARTVVLNHRYRVSASRIEEGKLVIDASYELVSE
jgi:hypothetical protein